MKRSGVTLGPSSRCTRHSDLGTLKSWLCGERVSFGYKAHNNFGSAVHMHFLLRKPGKFKLSIDEIHHKGGMIQSLNRDPIVRRLMAVCPTREKRKPCTLNGVRMKFTADAHGKRVAVDLKTTICGSKKDFVKSAIKYGYFRQGLTYMKGLSLKEYWIIGIQKVFPYKVYLVCITT